VKKVLMISYFFPPVGGIGTAGSQRTLKFAKYIQSHDWTPVILTVRESHYESYFELDASLLGKVPSGINIVRTPVIRWLTKLLELKNRGRASIPTSGHIENATNGNHSNGAAPASRNRYQKLKNAFTDLFEIPDGEIGWLIPGVISGLRAIRREGVDVIYTSGKPWTAHLIGVVLRGLTGKPLVTDFRDPWLTNPFRDQSMKFRNRVEGYLEQKVVSEADLVITNTVLLRDEFIARFPREAESKFVALLNGYDPDDFPRSAAGAEVGDGKFVLVHSGFLYGKRDPRNFLEALTLLLRTQRIPREKIEVHFVGSVELPYNLPEFLRANGLEGVVHLVPHVPFQRSLEYLSRATALLLLQPGTETQIPSKLFEYIAMGRPILTISPLHGATSKLVMEESLGIATDAENVNEIALALERLYHDWKGGSRFIGGSTAREKFNVRKAAENLSRNFDRLLDRGES